METAGWLTHMSAVFTGCWLGVGLDLLTKDLSSLPYGPEHVAAQTSSKSGARVPGRGVRRGRRDKLLAEGLGSKFTSGLFEQSEQGTSPD